MSSFFRIASALALSIVILGRADEASPDEDCTDGLGSLSPSLLQFKSIRQQEEVVEDAKEAEVLEDPEVEGDDGLPVCSNLITHTIISKSQALCLPSSGGRVEYTGKPCGNNQIEWMESRALDRRGGLSPSQCQWDWSSHASKSFYAGSCGEAPTVDGGDQLPMRCRASSEGPMAQNAAGKYWTARSFCEHIQCDPIASEYRCNLAAKSLGLPNVSMTHSTGERPGGCFVYQKGSVEFNSNLEARTDWDDTESLCACGAAGPQVTCSCSTSISSGRTGPGFDCNDGSTFRCPGDQVCAVTSTFPRTAENEMMTKVCKPPPTPRPTPSPKPQPTMTASQKTTQRRRGTYDDGSQNAALRELVDSFEDAWDITPTPAPPLHRRRTNYDGVKRTAAQDAALQELIDSFEDSWDITPTPAPPHLHRRRANYDGVKRTAAQDAALKELIDSWKS